MMLISIVLPPRVMSFYEHIMEIVRFDIFEEVFRFDQFVGYIFGLPDVPVSSDAEDLGYGSHFIVTNLSALLVFFFISVCLYFCFSSYHGLLSWITCKPGRAMKFTKEWTDKFKWNGLIQFFNETYLCLCIVVFFNRDAIDFTKGWALAVNSIVAVLGALGVLVVPMIIFHTILKYYGPALDLANLLKFRSYQAITPEAQSNLKKKNREVTWAQICVYNYQEAR